MKFSSPSLRGLSFESLERLSERDRKLLLIAAVALLLILVFAVILPLERAVGKERAKLAQKRADLAWMQGIDPGAIPPGPSDHGESLLVIIDRSAREASLAKAMSGSEPGSNGSLSVRLERAPFDRLIEWLNRLAIQNGVVVDSATIEKSGDPGAVNATIVLHAG